MNIDWEFAFFAALMIGWVVVYAVGAWMIERRLRDEEDAG